MKTRFKTSPNSQKQSILKNTNFLNNQNYILGKNEKNNILNNMKNINTEFFHKDYGKLYKKDLFNNYFYYLWLTIRISFILIIFLLIFISGFKEKIFFSIFILYLIYLLFNKLNREKEIEKYKIYKNKNSYYYKK